MNKQIRILFAASWIFALLTSFGLVYNAQQDPSTWDFPRLDDLFMTVAYPRSYAMSLAKSCQIDNYIGMTVLADINTLHNAPYYWNISINPGFHMCYIGVSCRPVTPSSSGSVYDYHGRTPGFRLYPLNISQFRLALKIIVSGFISTWISDLFGFIVTKMETVVPPANVYWYNPCIPSYPSDWVVAESLLVGAGFIWDKGPDGIGHTIDDKWTCPNGMVLWDGTRASQPKSDRLAGVNPNVYGIWVMCPASLVDSTSYEIIMRHLEMWNLFFCGIQAGRGIPPTDPDQLLFIDDAQSDPSVVVNVAFVNRDHDLYFLCAVLSRNPDYLYDFFHPDMDFPDGDNSAGLVHAGLDRCLETIKFWKFKDWELLTANTCNGTLIAIPCTTYGPYGPFKAPVPISVEIERANMALGVYDQELIEGVNYTSAWQIVNGKYFVTIHIELPFALNKGEALEVKFPAGTYERLITDKLELRTVVYLVQWKFWYLVPYLPFYSRNLINMYKVIMEQNRWLEDWVDSPGYGSEPTIAEMPWTVDSLHWNNPSFTSMNYHVPGPVYTLNPIAASWSYEWQVINRIHESLYVINPYTHDDMPWIALNWTMEEWIDKNQGIENGMILHVYLRNDAYWQDGNQITSADVAWNFEFIESLTPPEYTQVWKPLIKYEIADPYVIRLYINATGLWQAYTMLDSALRFPKPAWEDFVGDYNTTTTVDYNAAVAYQPWTVLRNTKPGNNGPSDLTMLYGSGAYYFRYWDKTIGKGILKLSKNPNYWARVNVQNMQTTIGIDGLLYGWQQYELSDPTPPNYETTVAIRTTLTNVNMFSPVNISKHLIMYHWPTNMYEDTAMQITLSSGQVHTEVIIKDLIPLPNRIGDLGKRTGTPPSAKWFLYDDVVDGTDLALFLIALKGNAPILFRMLIDNPATLQEVEVIRIDVEWMEPWWSR